MAQFRAPWCRDDMSKIDPLLLVQQHSYFITTNIWIELLFKYYLVLKESYVSLFPHTFRIQEFTHDSL